MKAVLFDIDGTILNCNGAGKSSLLMAAKDIFGTFGEMKRVDFQGKTDPLILHESLINMGFDENTIKEKTEPLKEKYFHYLNSEIYENDIILFPGVEEILKVLEADKNILLGLLTGNFTKSAKIKLTRYDLNKYFPFGVFGDDSFYRNQMPGIAKEKIRTLYDIDIDFKDIFIIGDTIYDIECAEYSGSKSIAVGTGWTDKKILLNKSPDYYFDDLSDTKTILNIISQ